MKRILFVDDDAQLLEGLRLRLWPMQAQWTMRFVDTGGQAVAEFQREPFDVIVSDVRMPGVQGARLLRTISERWPEAVRIALSGVTDPKETLHLVPIAHQFLSKPCESPLLENTIERCLRLQELASEHPTRALAGRVRRLAPQRHAYSKLMTLLSADEAEVAPVARIIASDTVLTAKVAQLASSAFFRHGKPMASIDQAVAYLGLETLRSVTMTIEVFSQGSEKSSASALSLERLQQHTLTTARIARALAAETPFADEAFLAGLLHDIGYWIFAQECPRELDRAVAQALAKGIPLHEAEHAVMGTSHAQIGAYLLGIWGLPQLVIEAVARHHERGAARPHDFNVTAALTLAHGLSGSGDEIAFSGPLRPDREIGPDYLAQVCAPFDWSEAQRRAAQVLQTSEA